MNGTLRPDGQIRSVQADVAGGRQLAAKRLLRGSKLNIAKAGDQRVLPGVQGSAVERQAIFAGQRAVDNHLTAADVQPVTGKQRALFTHGHLVSNLQPQPLLRTDQPLIAEGAGSNILFAAGLHFAAVVQFAGVQDLCTPRLYQAAVGQFLRGKLRVAAGGQRAVVGHVARTDAQIAARRQAAVPHTVIARIDLHITHAINLRGII